MDVWTFLAQPVSHVLTLAIGATVSATTIYKWFYLPEKKRSDRMFEVYESALKRILNNKMEGDNG